MDTVTSSPSPSPSSSSLSSSSPAGALTPEQAALDAFDPAWKHDPYLSYRVLRDAGPFPRGPLDLRLVPRYREIDAILQDPTWSHAEEGELMHPDSDGSDLPVSFLWMEPPDHTRLRRLVSKAFSARRVETLRDRITVLADDLVDKVIEKGDAELVEDVAYPLPLTIISEMLGVPAEAHATVRAMSFGLARGLDPDVLLSPEELDNRRRSAVAFAEFFGELVAQRRARPADDLISDLALVEAEGDRLTSEEMLATLVVLLVAGHETTVNLIGNMFLALMRNPDQYALLCANPEVAGPAVDELMRFDGPVHLTTRVATRDVEVSGHSFAAGEGVVILLASASRDPRAYRDPDRLDLARYAGREAVPRHLGFGRGHHYCIGSPLVRVEVEHLMRALARRAPKLTLLADPPPYRPNLVVRGLHALPVHVCA